MAKDAYYFKHDANARTDHKIKALIRKYGVEGYGRYWIIIEELRNEEGYKLKDKPYTWDALAEQMQCTSKEIKEFISDCVNTFELFIQEEGFFYSQALLTRLLKLDEIRSKRKYAAHVRWDNEEQ